MQTGDADFLKDVTSVPTEIVEVTVYPDQARVIRRGLANVHTGTLWLDVGCIPATGNPESVQVAVTGEAQATLQRPHIRPVTASEQADNQSRSLQAQLQTAEQAFRHCKDTLGHLQQQKAFLATLSEQSAQCFAAGLSQRALQLQDVAEFITFFETASQENAAAIAAQELAKQAADRQLQQARQTLQQAQAGESDSLYQLMVPLMVHQAGQIQVEIRYRVTAAQWRPIYDARMTTDAQVKLTRMAAVQQHTGEDWSAVNLSVATVAPPLQPLAPEPQVLRIENHPVTRDDRAPETATSRIRSPILSETYRMLGAVPGSELPSEQSEESTQEDRSSRSAIALLEFAATAPVTLASDRSVQNVVLEQLSLPAATTYIALPQHSHIAYCCTDITHPSTHLPLLPGTVNLFCLEGYCGASQLDYVAPQGRFQLSWGLAPGIKIQRELIQQQTSSVEAHQDLRSYRVQLTNALPRAVEVMVIEPMPISRTQKICVSLIQSKPTASIDASGQCRWLVSLAPGATTTIQYQYGLEYPTDLSITGLEG